MKTSIIYLIDAEISRPNKGYERKLEVFTTEVQLKRRIDEFRLMSKLAKCCFLRSYTVNLDIGAVVPLKEFSYDTSL